MILTVALGGSAFSNAIDQQQALTFEQFAELLRAHWHVGKLPHGWADAEAVNQDKNTRWFSLARFRAPVRNGANVESVSGFVGDFDTGAWATPETISMMLTGIKHLTYSTYSNSTERAKFRVVVPYAAPATAIDHGRLWDHWNTVFLGALDANAKDAPHLFYFPSSAADMTALAQWHIGDGALFNPVTVLPSLPPPAPPDEAASTVGGWTDEPVAAWRGPADDDALIALMRERNHATEGVSFRALWDAADTDVLARRWRALNDHDAFDHSSADASLFARLAHYTGNNCERIERLARRSGLCAARAGSAKPHKWDSPWLRAEIQRACARCDSWLNAPDPTEIFGHANVPGGSPGTPAAVPPPPSPVPTVLPIPKAQHLCTDQANAERLQKRYGDQLIACAGTFYTWDGKRWKGDDGLAQRFACELSKMVRDEADALLAQVEAAARALPTATVSAHLDHPRLTPIGGTIDGQRLFELKEIAEGLAKWSKDCEMKAKQDAALGLLKKLLAVDASLLDADQWLLNCDNGTLDLRTGTLREHRASDFITKLAPVAYDPAAQAPRFNAFLADIFAANTALIEFVQRWHGYAATGSTREHYLVIHWGSGSNGKSTLIKAVESVLGDYATAAATGLLTAKEGDGRHPAEIAKLRGARLVTASETEDGAKLREAFVKQITGGDKLTARRMYGEWFDFIPSHKLQLFTNSKPQVRGSDFGIWRRLLLVPYTVKFGTAEQVAAGEAMKIKDTQLAEALEQERPGVLAWIIEGARTWYKDGLRPPDIVLAASRDYREEQDRLGEFIRECCQLNPQAKQELPLLYTSYRGWCHAAGIDRPLTRQRFLDELEQRVPGFERPKKSHGTNYIKGIALVAMVGNPAATVAFGSSPAPLPAGAIPVPPPPGG